MRRGKLYGKRRRRNLEEDGISFLEREK